MQLFIVKKGELTHPLYSFFSEISSGLSDKIYDKFQTYIEYGDIYSCKSLKTLNSRIWKYKGTIYKLRVDYDNQSARVLFSKSKNGDLVIIHAFLKSTRKTPSKEARQAIFIYQKLESIEKKIWEKKAF